MGSLRVGRQATRAKAGLPGALHILEHVTMKKLELFAAGMRVGTPNALSLGPRSLVTSRKGMGLP